MGELRGHYAKWKNQSQKENTEWFHFHENSKIVKFIEVESRMVVARHGGTKFQLWKWVDSSDLTYINMTISSVQFSRSVMSNSLRPHEPQHARPPVHHQLPESTQTHVHWVSDAIQPSHPLSFPSPLALNLFQHWGLFKWVSSWHQVVKVLELQLQHQSYQWTPSTDLLQRRWTGFISLQSNGLSRVFSNTTVQKHQFFGAQLSL